MKFRSKFEKRIYANAKKSRKKLEYEPKDNHLNYTVSRRYVPDFVLPNGIIIEAKGYFKSSDRTKMLRVSEANPSLDIRFLFQKANNTLTKAKNSIYYWQWAERNNFKWAEGDKIPLAWWRE